MFQIFFPCRWINEKKEPFCFFTKYNFCSRVHFMQKNCTLSWVTILVFLSSLLPPHTLRLENKGHDCCLKTDSQPLYHETIILTGITCNKISCYMRHSACRGPIVENAKVLKIFEFSHAKEIVESWLVYANKILWIIRSGFLTETIKRS